MKSQMKERRMTTVVSKRLIATKSALAMTLIIGASFTFTGCGKPLAKWDMNKAESLIHQSAQWDAAKYDQSKSAFEQAEKSLSGARSAYNGNNVDEARTQAKEAVTYAKSALEAATAQFSAQEREAAKKAVEVARENDAQFESVELFKQTEEELTKLDRAYEKQKFEKSIKIAAHIQENVRILLAAKKSAADTRLAELQDLRSELAAAKASVYNAPALNLLDEKIASFMTQVVKNRAYKKAITEMTKTVAETHEAIAETKRRCCEHLLDSGQKQLDNALANEADLFAKANLTICQKLMTETLKAYWDKQYDTAIPSAEKLLGDAQRLVYEACIESTRDKIEKAKNDRNELEAQNVEKYISGRIAGINELIDKANLLFANNEFQSAKATALTALDDLKELDESFNDLSGNELEKANAVEAISKKTFTRMNDIFSSDQLWASAEARRLINEANLAARLDEADQLLKSAAEARDTKNYSKAIENGKLASSKASDIENDIYGITARYALLRVQNELSVLERQNSLNLAPVQTAQVAAYVNEAQSLLDKKDPRAAVESAARARSYIENVKQEMTRRTIVEQNRAEHMVRRIETGNARSDNPGGSDKSRYESMSNTGGNGIAGVPVTNTVPAAATTNNPLSENQSAASYEKPTLGAPFVAKKPVVDLGPQPNSVHGLWNQVENMINDEHRIQHIRRYYPASLAEARTAIQESHRMLEAQDYSGAFEAATRAQRTILEAESKAAKKAAASNLATARSRMSMAKSAGSQLFAPDKMNEAENLISEAQKMINAGNNVQAYEVSRRALEAAETARNYNVVKARETGALALRYGGQMNSHPLLTDSQINADLAEKLLKHPKAECRLEGQEIAKLAVYQAQLALDHARDWSFQERIDNIYKALNTATRAGANWFNPVEVKRLIDELHTARCEYNTRNYDAVELKLNDIEAGMARIIETTPQILEQNVSEQTDRLNALLDAGAENYVPQDIDDAKSFMNNAVIDFRNESYGSSYQGMRKAIEKVDNVELAMQEQVYYDAVTELFSQLDLALVKFSNVTEAGPAFIKRLVTSPTGSRASISLSGRMNPNEFYDAVNDIYLRAMHLAPPKGQEGTQDKVLLCIKYCRTAAKNFQKLYIMDHFDPRAADEVVDTAFDQLNKCKRMRSDIQFNEIDKYARTKVFAAEKIVNY